MGYLAQMGVPAEQLFIKYGHNKQTDEYMGRPTKYEENGHLGYVHYWLRSAKDHECLAMCNLI